MLYIRRGLKKRINPPAYAYVRIYFSRKRATPVHNNPRCCFDEKASGMNHNLVSFLISVLLQRDDDYPSPRVLSQDEYFGDEYIYI